MAEPLGALQRQKLLDGGMAPSDVAVWQADQEQKLLAGGMNAGDISLYFGQPNPDTAAIDKKIQPSLAIPGAKVATNMWENFLAGIQGSTIVPMAKAAWATNPFVLTSNAGRDFAKGRMPDPVGDIQEALDPANSAPTLVAPAENDFMGTVAHGAGMTLGDAPLWLSTFLSTTAAAVETGPAAPFIGAGAASALTSTARNVYVDAWTHPNDGLVGSKDWQARAAGISLNVGVETTIGVASMGAGMLASKVAAPILAPVVGETGAKVGGFVAGAGAPIPFIANTNSLMERGELAGPQEYAEATAMLIGGMALGPVMHITGHLGKPSPKVSADNMSRDGQQMYDTLTGVFVDKNLTPDEVSMAAANDPVVRQEILAPFDEHGNWATPELDRLSTLSGRADPAEMPLKVEPPPKVEGEEPIAPAPPHLKAEDVPPVHLDVLRSLEGSEDGLINLDGRVGAFQLNAQEAEAHGFKGANLADPAVNEKVAASIIADLSNKFNGNMEDMVVGWVGGDSAARLWISQGRDFNQLPKNIQRKLLQAEAEGALGDSHKYQNIDLENQYTERGGSVDWIPPASGGGGGKKPPLSGEVIPPAPGPKKIEGTVPREPTLDEHMDNVLDFIGPDDRPGLLDTLKNTWVGFTHALDTIQSEPRRQDRRLGVGKNEFGIEDLKRTTFSSRDRVGLFNNKGAVRLSFKGVEPVWEVDLSVPSIEAAIGLVKKNKGNMRDFLAYWMSAHALELEMAGTRSGLTPEQIASARAVQGDKGMVAKYEGPLQAFQANKNAALEYVHAAGFWNDKTWPVIRGQFTAHLYWGRYFDKLATQSGLNGRSLKPGQPTKEQKGSGRLLNSNPLVNDSVARALMIVAADRNLAMRGIVDVINGKDPIPGFNTVKDGTATSKLVKDMETGEYLPADLMGPDGKPIPEGELNLAKPLLVEQYINAKYADRFVVWRNGEPEVWQASSPEMLEVMRLAGPGSKDLVSKVFHGITQWARRGIVGAPFFGLKTLTYGELTKWAQGGAMPYIGLMDGIFASINPKFKGAWDQARANGTFADFTEDLNSRYGWLDVESVFQTTGTARRVFNTVAAPFTAPGKVLRAVNQYLHNASAFGNMRYLERKGLSPTKAAQQTRVHMLDPAEASVQPALEWIARSVNFLRSAQLEAQAINRSLNPTIPGNFTNAMTNLAKMAVAMTIPSMMQVASQLALDRNRKDEDKYYNQQRWARDRYWRIGDMQWPAPPSMLTTVFKVLPERMMEYMLTQNPHSFDELWGNLASNMAPTLIPTLPAPAIESWANKDFMFNTPIVSRGMQGLAGEMQYNANSTETAKAIARAVGSQNPFGSWNWSPMHIDNWAREWGGTMPVQILKIVEGPFKPVRKSTDAADIPFLGAFFVRKYGAGQQLDDFYDAYTKYSTAHQSYNEALDRNNPAEIAAFASSDYAKATKVDIGGGVMVSIQGAYVAINQALAVIRAIDMLPNPDGTTPSGAADLMDAISNKDKFGLTTVEERPLNASRPAMTPDEKRLAIDTIAAQVYVASKTLTDALDKAASAK